jgi:hypothetical protein
VKKKVPVVTVAEAEVTVLVVKVGDEVPSYLGHPRSDGAGCHAEEVDQRPRSSTHLAAVLSPTRPSATLESTFVAQSSQQ